MFELNINPVLFQIGSLQIRYYGIIYVLGFVLLYFFVAFLAKERKLPLSKDDVSDLVLYVLFTLLRT